MGTSGLVGPIMTYQTMSPHTSMPVLLIEIAVMQFILPAVITLAVSEGMRKLGYIKNGDMKIKVDD